MSNLSKLRILSAAAVSCFLYVDDTAVAQSALGENLQSFTESFVPVIEQKTEPKKFKKEIIRQPPKRVTTTKVVRRNKSDIKADVVELLTQKAVRGDLNREFVESIGGTAEFLQSATPQDSEALSAFFSRSLDDKEIETTARRLNVRTQVKRKTTKLVPQKPIERVVPQKRPRRLIFSNKSTVKYSTNAFRSRRDPVGDISLTDAASAILLLPVGPEEDTLSLVAGLNSTRFRSQTALDNDLVVGNAAYTKVIGRNATLAEEPLNLGTRETDTLSFSVLTISVFGPTYEEFINSFVKPAMNVKRSNILIGDEYCDSPSGPYHCLFADLEATLSTTWFRNGGNLRDNSALKLSGKIARKFEGDGLVLAVQASAEGKLFHQAPGGREDLEINAKVNAIWPLTGVASLEFAGEYNNNISSLNSANWDGFHLYGTVSFNIPAKTF